MLFCKTLYCDNCYHCRYIREAGVPFVVAINKIDKPNADVEKTKRSLMLHDVVVEDMGGDIPCVEISALQGINLDKLQVRNKLFNEQ